MPTTSRRTVLLIVVVAQTIATLAAQPVLAQLAPIRYVVRIREPKTHYLEVEATYPTARMPVVELMMAVWTPGSYLIREFERHVEDVRAHDPTGQSLAIKKTRKNRWEVATARAAFVVVSYRVYANEKLPRTNWVNESFALINGAPTFITMVDRANRPHDVVLELPAAWARSLTAMPPAPDGRPHHYLAPDYDTLVDSPILAGNVDLHQFAVDAIPHALVNAGETQTWDGARSSRDVERIVRAARDLWGTLPYDRYFFFNIAADAYDAIEHKSSAVFFAYWWSTRTDDTYHDWLALVAHEFFHAWNVKRLRPVELGPFDYENEVYTRSLWVAEGLTDYYSFLLLARAGLITRDETLTYLSTAIGSLQSSPGRLVQPLEAASYDAWIKQYRPDENSANVSVSYYTKGSVVGLLLDAKMRHVTNGAHTLDDAMRLAYQRYSGPRGYTPAEFRAVVNQVAGVDLSTFLHLALESTEELNYDEFLDWYGLRFAPLDSSTVARATLGVTTNVADGRVVVSGLNRGTPAYGSGVDVGDELLAIDDVRIGAGELDSILRRYRPGTVVTLLVSRRGVLRRVPVELAAESFDRWKLMVRPQATPAQQARLSAWLGTR